MFNFALLVNWTNCPLYTFYFAVLGQPAKKLHYSTSSQLGELKRQIKRDRENKHHTLKEEEGGGSKNDNAGGKKFLFKTIFYLGIC